VGLVFRPCITITRAGHKDHSSAEWQSRHGANRLPLPIACSRGKEGARSTAPSTQKDPRKQISMKKPILVTCLAWLLVACAQPTPTPVPPTPTSPPPTASVPGWTRKADMPTARWCFSTCVVDGVIYAIGGVGGATKVEAYDPATDTWTKGAALSDNRNCVAVAAVGGKIYAFGGNPATWGRPLASVVEYDPSTDTWTPKADMPEPTTGGPAVVLDGKIYVFGGLERGGGRSTVFRYDPVTDTWTTEPDMPFVRTTCSASVVGGKVYLIGGSATEYPCRPFLATVWEYELQP